MAGREGGARTYDAFLSYSRRLDGQIATSLERELQRFAKPWYRARALRVFRDASSLSANPALWPSIEDALANTRYFVLLASPASAASPWVGREVQWWLANRPLDRVIIALTAGQLPWDATAPVPPPERAIAGYLAARFGTEAPRWVDLRALHHESQVSRHNPVVQDAVADIGATVRGVPKDLLVGEHIREHRRTLRIAGTGLVLLAILAVLSTVASVVVFAQRNTARQQARVATARQLAATAESSIGTDLSQAMLLAAAGYRMAPSAQTLQAVYSAATASPKLTRFLYAPATITALAVTPEGRSIIVGDASGAIIRFDRATGTSTRVGTMPHVDQLAASTDAAVLVATDGRRVAVFGRSSGNLTVAKGRSVHAVAVSPDGRTVVMGGSVDATLKGFVDIVAVATRQTRELTGSDGVALVAATDNQVSVVGFNGWATADLSGHVLASGTHTGVAGTHVYATAIAADGSRFSYTNSNPVIPVWPLSGDPDIDHPALAGRGPGHSPTALALAPDGTRMAVADSGTIYVSALRSPTGAQSDYTAELTGVGDRPTTFVAFAGDTDHLVSSAGNQIAIWSLVQTSTVAVTQFAAIEPGCVACPGTFARVAPDGHRLAFTGSSSGKLVVHDVSRDVETTVPRDASTAAPSWSTDGRDVYLPLPQHALAVIDASTGKEVTRIPVHAADEYVYSQALSATSVAVVDSGGGVALVDLRTRTSRYLPGPLTRQHAGASSAQQVSISPDGTTVYYATTAGLEAMDLHTGRIAVLDKAQDFAAVAAVGTWLLVTRYHSVELRSLPSGRVQRSFSGPGVFAAANGSGGLLAYQTDDGAVHVVDVASGVQLGTFVLPGSAESRKTTLVFSADGSRLYALTEGLESGGQIQSWELDPDTMITALCHAAGRHLTSSEWRAAAPGQPYRSGCS